MINFYFSSLVPNSLEGKYLSDKLNACVLLSQLNDRTHINNWININKSSGNRVKLFVDSGAYTCWTKGTSIDIDEYIDYLNSISDDVECYASLDVIPGIAGSSYIPTFEEADKASQDSWNNYLYMRQRVKHPEKLLYTFHMGEDPKYLIRALSYHDSLGPIGYLGLGGVVGKTDTDIESFLYECFDIIKNSKVPNVRVHTFGMTRFKLLTKFPIYSTDSTSYIQKGAFGAIMINNSVIPVSDNSLLDDRNIINRSPVFKESLLKILEQRNMTLEQLQTSRDSRVLFNCISYYEWASKYEYAPEERIVEESLW